MYYKFRSQDHGPVMLHTHVQRTDCVCYELLFWIIRELYYTNLSSRTLVISHMHGIYHISRLIIRILCPEKVPPKHPAS